MPRMTVRSSNIRSVGYDGARGVLEIEFQDGHVYQYSGVSESTYSALMRSCSKGTYFHDFIKERYGYRRVA